MEYIAKQPPLITAGSSPSPYAAAEPMAINNIVNILVCILVCVLIASNCLQNAIFLWKPDNLCSIMGVAFWLHFGKAGFLP